MLRPDDRCVKEAIKLAGQLADLADRIQADSRDNGCALLCATLRESARNITRRAERELEIHQALANRIA
jgi:hypothetical protein